MTKIKPARIIKFIIFILFIAAAVFSTIYFDLGQYFQQEKIETIVNQFGILAPIAYIVIYILATLLFLPDALLAIAGGALFGKYLGTLYSMTGVVIGATIAFLMARYLGRDFIEKWVIEKSSTLQKYDKKLKRHGLWVMLVFRLIPFFPYNALNFALGLTDVKLSDYIITTVIGLVPGTFMYSYFGDALAQKDWTTLIVLAIIVMLILLVLWIYWRWSRKYPGKDKAFKDKITNQFRKK